MKFDADKLADDQLWTLDAESLLNGVKCCTETGYIKRFDNDANTVTILRRRPGEHYVTETDHQMTSCAIDVLNKRISIHYTP